MKDERTGDMHQVHVFTVEVPPDTELLQGPEGVLEGVEPGWRPCRALLSALANRPGYQRAVRMALNQHTRDVDTSEALPSWMEASASLALGGEPAAASQPPPAAATDLGVPDMARRPKSKQQGIEWEYRVPTMGRGGQKRDKWLAEQYFSAEQRASLLPQLRLEAERLVAGLRLPQRAHVCSMAWFTRQ